ncbi:class GN sortase [Paraglaciecola sp.]|uniref:class GN sortase n=1 Tax=Paraglaciecola sp. TaxID=1920173 RepID=UPI00273D1107|nr:class GN sortase [Paraglaciecola sp.]MDP5030105.1 class GN sortase [Paraglaciecola sp.]
MFTGVLPQIRINPKQRSYLFAILGVVGLYQLTSGLWIFVKAHVAQYLIASAWQATLLDQQAHRPWSWADTYPVAELSIGAQHWYVLAGANGRNLAFGPTHLSASPLPGERGNTVIVGHRDTQFNSLKTLKNKDTIKVAHLNGSTTYQVTDRQIIPAALLGTSTLLNQEQFIQPSLTLITCYPFDSITPNPSLRFVVNAVKIGD